MSKDGKERTLIIQAPTVLQPKPEDDDRAVAWMVLLHPPGPDIGRRTELSRRRYAVGRETDSDLTVSRDSVSRKHAEMWRDERNTWHVTDLGSTNGTFVNEQPVQEQSLRDGDQVRFGDAIFKFLSGRNIESHYHEEIYKLTIHDALTGLHNKRYLLDFLERELSAAHRHGHPLSLVMFDIDHFKQVNDTRSHLCGDEVLKELGKRLGPRMRREDLIARYGGEEFAAVLSSTPLQGGLAFAEAVRALIADYPFHFANESFQVTISLGVTCVHHQPDVSMQELMRRADTALYEAKRTGRNRVCYSTPPPQ